MKTYIIHYYLNEWKLWETTTIRAESAKQAMDNRHAQLIRSGWKVRRSTMRAEKVS